MIGLNLLLIAAYLVALTLSPHNEAWVRGLYTGLFGLVTIAIGLKFQPGAEKLASSVKERLPRNRTIWSALLGVFIVYYLMNSSPVDAWAAIMAGMLGMVLSYFTIKFYPSRVFLTNTCAIAGLVLVGIAAAGEPVLAPLLEGVEAIPFMADLNTDFLGGYYDYVIILLAFVAGIWLVLNVIFLLVSIGWVVRRDWSGTLNSKSKTGFLPQTFDLQIFSNTFEFRLWLIFIPVIWTLLLRVFPKGEGSETQKLLSPEQVESLITMGTSFNILNLFAFFLIVICGGITFAQFNSKSKKGVKGLTEGGEDGHTKQDSVDKVRLVIGNPLLLITNLSPLLFALPFMLDATLTNGAIENWFIDNSHLGWVILIGIGIGGFWQREGIKNGIDFALDVTMYFNKQEGVREENDQEQDVVYGKIMSRMQAIVDDVVNRKNADNEENRPKKVVFLTHSQGTALTRHFLAEKYQPAGIDSYFVTMGSPISHIYQNYFLDTLWRDSEHPNLYREDDDTAQKRWLNMHRKSDYIGRTIDEDTFNVENMETGEGGHTGYFVDDIVHAKLEKEGLVLKK